MEESFRKELATLRTDSVYRRIISALLQAYETSPNWTFWFRLTGSIFDNTMSTLDIPDFDFLALCDFRDMKKRFRLQVEPDECIPEYFRIRKLSDCNEDKAIEHIRSQLKVC